MNSHEPARCEVLVIGGGPGGATVATLLARRGIDVVVLDKDRHPRFHIGESLLPANLPLFEQLGVADEIRAIGMHKPGIEFVSPSHAHRSYLEFSDSWNASLDHAYQVRRSDFDHVLLRNAERSGARVRQGCRVKDARFEDEHVDVDSVDDDGTPRKWRARFLIDASGRDTFLATRMKLKQKNKAHNSSALFAHFEGAQRLPGRIEGNISIFWFEHGWFWFIPLPEGVTSVGAVCWPYYLKSRSKPLPEFFQDTIALSPPLAERLQGARLVSEVHATGNYSYSSTRCYGHRHLMIGDAFTFIDPVFSSGVYLAMRNAFQAADTVQACLADPAAAPRALARFDRHMRYGPREFSWFIYRVTNPSMRDLFMYPKNVLRVRSALLSLLGGDIYGESPIRPSLWAFKSIYYLTSLAKLPRTLRAARQRRINIRDTQPS
ncbi:MAG: NAD(P)/FAD-dependent oxidoreductase [Burkholderiaceae bacterium]